MPLCHSIATHAVDVDVSEGGGGLSLEHLGYNGDGEA